MKIIEQWGTGIPRIIEMCKEYELPEPEFIEIGMDFRVNLYRKQSAEKTNNQSLEDKNQSIEWNNQLIGDNNQFMDKQNQLIHSIDGNSSTKEKARMVCENLCNDAIFGRTEIMKITGLSTSAAGSLINKLKDAKLVVPVTGKGKGKYKFTMKIANSR